jgi:hypothetical protein
METTKKKPAVRKKTATSKKNLSPKKEKSISQTWKAFMDTTQEPGLEIVDMEAVLQ